MSESKVVVRRAKPKDVPAIAGLINAARKGKSPLSKEEVRDRILQKGYRIAIARQGAAVVGWQTENLVTLVDDFYVYPLTLISPLALPLLEEVEKAARELACEAIIFFLDQDGPEQHFSFLLDKEYLPREMGSLHPYWQEVARERVDDGSVMMVKQISDQIRIEPF
jgi:N-acetylglutamate synthase-like GNAT family acetyltransferase